MIRCELCGTEHPDYAVVCEHCGAFLPKTDLTGGRTEESSAVPPKTVRDESILDPLGERRVRCSYCWTENWASDTVCTRCGMPLEYVPYPEKEGEYGEIPERGKVPEYVNPDAAPVPEGMIRCRSCWRDNPKDSVRCQFCGKAFHAEETRKAIDNADYGGFKRLRDTLIKCVECGALVPWNAATCSRCGYNPRAGKPWYVKDEDETGSLIAEAIGLALTERKRRENETRLENERIERSRNRSKINYAVAGKIRCRQCWQDNPPGTKVCSGCGSRLPAVTTPWVSCSGRKSCTCGYKNLPGVTVCLKCGGQIRSEEAKLPEKRKICTCGYQNLPGVTVCLMCKGTVLRKCIRCGYENPAYVTVCANCKQKLQ